MNIRYNVMQVMQILLFIYFWLVIQDWITSINQKKILCKKEKQNICNTVSVLVSCAFEDSKCHSSPCE